jgi:hypothetical protein
MALEAVVNRNGVHRIVLQQRREGTYVLVFEKPTSEGPEWDYLQDDLDMAKRMGRLKYGVQETEWHVIPETDFMQPCP